MISAINGINSYISAYSVSSTQIALTTQTRSLLESMGINTAGIKTESEGQSALQQARNSQDSQRTRNTQMQQPQQDGNQLMKIIMEDALSLAQKVGATVTNGAKLDEVLTAISDKLSQMQADAANNPQKLAQVTAYQAEYLSICQLATDMQASMQASSSQKVRMDTAAIQTSMTGLANYNIASMSISATSKLKT